MGRGFIQPRPVAAAALVWLFCALCPSVAPAQSELSDPGDLADLQTRFQSIAERVSPSVVAISASTTQDLSPDAVREEELNPQKLDAILSKTTRIIGTGFIISS